MLLYWNGRVGLNSVVAAGVMESGRKREGGRKEGRVGRREVR